ncbi:MAG TPA: hypothetical protein VFL89_03075 [Solirubrobacterales bacterium]|nr:hypothetical protein [Solirubrobacterales bacterium]
MPEFGSLIEVALPAVPLLLLVGSLLFGRYPGCDAVVRLSERLAGGARRGTRTGGRARQPLPPRRFAAAGGLLIAFGHAQRPPPPLPSRI